MVEIYYDKMNRFNACFVNDSESLISNNKPGY